MPEKQRIRAGRLLRRTVALVALLAVLVVGYYAGLIVWSARDITRIDALTGGDGDSGDTFLVVARSAGDSAFLLVRTADSTSGAVILPSRAFVDLPPCPDSVGRAGGPAAGALADVLRGRGPQCLVAAVELLSGLTVDHYVQIDLGATAAAVDAVGGVSCGRGPRRTGRQVADAVGVGAGPTRREARAGTQQLLLAGLMGEVAAARRVLHPVGTTRLVRALTAALTVDHDTGLGDLQRLAQLLRELGSPALPVAGLPLRAVDYRPVGRVRPPDSPVDPSAPVDLLVEPVDRSVFSVGAPPVDPDPPACD